MTAPLPSTPPDPAAPPVRLTPWHTASALTRLTVSGATGLAVGVVASSVTGARFGTLAGWDAAAIVFLLWVWVTIWRRDAAGTAAMALREDPSRGLSDLVLLVTAVASLFSVGLVLLGGSSARQGAQHGGLVLTLASVALSWAVVHTVFCLRYARLYYGDPIGGIDFNQDPPPTYADFAYLAFTLGMTFQVSDTTIRSGEIRRTALRHALLSFLFGTVILSVSINLVVTLSS